MINRWCVVMTTTYVVCSSVTYCKSKKYENQLLGHNMKDFLMNIPPIPNDS